MDEKTLDVQDVVIDGGAIFGAPTPAATSLGPKTDEIVGVPPAKDIVAPMTMEATGNLKQIFIELAPLGPNKEWVTKVDWTRGFITTTEVVAALQMAIGAIVQSEQQAMMLNTNQGFPGKPPWL